VTGSTTRCVVFLFVQTYGVRAAWEDPTDWVLSTCPWKNSELSDMSSLMRIRPKDVGLDAPTVPISSAAMATAAAAATPIGNTSSVVDAPDPLVSRTISVENFNVGRRGRVSPSRAEVGVLPPKCTVQMPVCTF